MDIKTLIEKTLETQDLPQRVYDAHVELTEAYCERERLRSQLWERDLKIRQELWKFGPPGRNEDERKLSYDNAKAEDPEYQELHNKLIEVERRLGLARARVAQLEAELSERQVQHGFLKLLLRLR